MGTIMIEHKMGGMLDHDLIEENLRSSDRSWPLLEHRRV